MSFEKVLPSGAVLAGTPLAYGEAWAVSQAVFKELAKLEIDINSINLEDFKKLDLSTELSKSHVEMFLAFKDIICSLLSSQKITEEADKCFKKFTYNKLKINGQTFENRDARKDYIFAAFYALWENVAPFFEGVSSSLKTS